jgi:hypothetical protein
LWEKVDRRAAPRRLRGARRIAVTAKLEHPSSVAFGDTFSHKGRRENRAAPIKRLQTRTD